MDSIIKPLSTQVAAINDHYDQVVQQLSVGDPAAKNRLKALAINTRHLFASFQEKIAHMKAGVETAPGLVPNQAVMVKMLAFYIKEVVYAIQLFSNLMKLANNVLSLKTIIDWFMKDLIAIRETLQKKKIWLQRSVNRIKQKVQKNIEWVKRTITVKITEVWVKAQKKFYEKQLESATKQTTVQKQQSSKTDKEKLADKKQAIAKEKIIVHLKEQVQAKTDELDQLQQSKKAIANDKTYWNARWKSEAEKDAKLYLNDTPKQGANR